MDVIVGWLQNDYGTLGRPSEAVAHALVAAGHRVAYIEPFRPSDGEATLEHRLHRGLHLFGGTGTPPHGHEIARAVLDGVGLREPVLLNFGVAEANWWLHYELAPCCARTVLVAYDKLAAWEAMAPRRALLEGVRRRLVASSDVVCGMSEGAIDDVPGAHYVGHGIDAAWEEEAVDATPEPTDLAAIPHPRAVYVGALSVRFDVAAVRALADAGVHVVVVGFAARPELEALAAEHPAVHLLGPRSPDLTPGYLLHADLGIVPHTDEPFTASMEPHKAYNYAAAGLRTVTLHTAHAPALDELVVATRDVPSFVSAALDAARAGRLSAADVARARSLTWSRVASALLSAEPR